MNEQEMLDELEKTLKEGATLGMQALLPVYVMRSVKASKQEDTADEG